MAQFTKPLDCLLPYRTVSGEHPLLPFKANGHFSIPQELYQTKPGSCDAGGFVNNAVTV